MTADGPEADAPTVDATLSPADAIDVTRLRRLVALFGLVLIGVTWPLWTADAGFPRIPFVFAAGRVPAFCHWLGTGAMLAGLLTALASGRPSRAWMPGLLMFATAALVQVVLNQHRLQTWTYQFALAAVVLAALPPHRALFALRLLTVSIYIHSALSKLDVTFIDGYGQTLITDGLLRSLGIPSEDWPLTLRRLAAGSLPVGELTTAVLLVLPATRRIGLGCSVLMHAALILTLGPGGLDHEWGVLLWNVFFIAQNVVLFRRRRVTNESEHDELRRGVAARGFEFTVTALLAVVILLPLAEPVGWIDHWPAWAVYASRPAQVRVYVHEKQLERLPASIRAHVQPPRLFEPWLRLRIDRWSLSATRAPIYPQARFHLGVALGVARRYELDEAIRVEIDGPADRRTGRRTSRTLIGTEELEAECATFFVNAFPTVRRSR